MPKSRRRPKAVAKQRAERRAAQNTLMVDFVTPPEYAHLDSLPAPSRVARSAHTMPGPDLWGVTVLRFEEDGDEPDDVDVSWHAEWGGFRSDGNSENDMAVGVGIADSFSTFPELVDAVVKSIRAEPTGGIGMPLRWEFEGDTQAEAEARGHGLPTTA